MQAGRLSWEDSALHGSNKREQTAGGRRVKSHQPCSPQVRPADAVRTGNELTLRFPAPGRNCCEALSVSAYATMK